MERLCCPSCRATDNTLSNFCKFCGIKLREVCNCWIKKKPYDGGHEKCPSYRLFQEEKLQT